MIRQHFARIAWGLRHCNPRHRGLDIASDGFFWAEAQWLETVSAVADACAESNPSFDRDRFNRACGAELRPDGSEYPTVAPR